MISFLFKQIHIFLRLTAINPKIQAELDDLRREIEDSDPKLYEEMDKIQDNLDEVSSNSEKEKLNTPLNKLGRFLKDWMILILILARLLKGLKKA
ncbi:hypothetical protein MSSIT_2149 [Methanosarcina siciliae T4/M]|uniref:Uncharacterized protein n=1 Tax=Methanosarcina siciliae T4/M TaxID=1434120 RepID=A0A0E3P5D8_9EURY|nr:hypothetical protein [Methanosarcina siciliae]AKB28868.1 hypothetical protein MSSIT_2149 [Methanosarcina siciliae T4/M]